MSRKAKRRCYGLMKRSEAAARSPGIHVFIINSRVIDNADLIPDDAAYATPTNSNRCAIGNGLFAKHLEASHSPDEAVPPPKHTIVIRSSQLEWKTKEKGEKRLLNPRAKFDLWQKCADCDVKTDSHFVDPFLKLFLGIPLMLVKNTDVPNNQANGTLCHLHKVHFREGFQEDDVDIVTIDGYRVRCVEASDVDSIEAVFADGDREGEHFRIEPKYMTCRVNLPLDCFLLGTSNLRHHVNMKMTQFPVLPNQATTGHKLQSKTKKNLVVSTWSYKQNWAYVVLSRVKTLSGLFLREPLDSNQDFSMDPRLVRMIDHFRTTKLPQPSPF